VPAPGPSKPYRCALIGLSNITSAPISHSLAGGRHALPYSHASALARIPEARVTAVCDLIPEAGERFVRQWGEVWPDLRVYQDAAEMLEREEIDVLGVCTPDDKHADLVIAAAERGVPAIMCEKPLATTLADADRMVAAVERHGTILSVEHTRRWDPFYARAKELIEAGKIGEVRSVVGTLHGERAMLFRNGTHVLDLMCWYAGAAPTRVFARLEPGFDDFTAYRGDGGRDPRNEPDACAYVEFANGARGFYNGIKGRIGHSEWDVLGTAGRIRINPATAELWTLDEATGELVLRPFPASMVMTGAIQGAYEELFALLRQGGTPRSSIYEGRQVVALIEGILASHQSGRLVELSALGAAGA
jgi:predicted dehydrogenase